MEESYSIEELTGRIGIPVRTLRYYIAEGLVPGPGSRGKGARYGPEHLRRLQVIRQLTAQHVPLTQIRQRLEQMSPQELQAETETRRDAGPSPRAYLESLLARNRAPAAAPSNLWMRHVLAPGVELHVRQDAESRWSSAIRQAMKRFEQP